MVLVDYSVAKRDRVDFEVNLECSEEDACVGLYTCALFR